MHKTINTGYFAEVIVPINLPYMLTYELPEEMLDLAMTGKRVVVAVRRKLLVGVIYRVTEVAPNLPKISPILNILDDNPILTEKHLKFWKWIAEYNMSSMGAVMNVALPAGIKLQTESIVVLIVDKVDIELDKIEQDIIDVLLEQQEIKLSELNKKLNRKSSVKYIKSLYEKGLLVIREDIQEKYKPKFETVFQLSEEYKTDEQKQLLLSSLEEKSLKQFDVLLALLSQNKDWVFKVKFFKQFDLSLSSYKTLIKKEIIVEKQMQVDRVKPIHQDIVKYTLSEKQSIATGRIQKAFKSDKVVLLHGETASGKTHIYARLIEEQIALGKQCLYLLPEIALTEQITHRLNKLFGGDILVYHSRFNTNERVEIWNKVKDGEVSVVVGARSAVFLPFKDLGLIVIDEEHETSYKQFDPAPRYHARDAAIVLAQIFKAKVLLGSATPSFESYKNALDKKYKLVTLSQKHGAATEPEYRIVDMAYERKTGRLKSIFSSVLIEGLEAVFERGEQAIIFQNLKGYVPVTLCRECGASPTCINCDVSLTYYKYKDVLKCHYCSHTMKPISSCGQCGSTDLFDLGHGTERIVEELELLFPNQVFARFDQESTRGKLSFNRILNSFENGSIDVLVGTQIVAKGLDFENVSLVGIINADQSLKYPDYRAHERSFQLFRQVAGRAGRKNNKGLVIIQSYEPKHFVIEKVLFNDFESFYRQEIALREVVKFPPMIRAIILEVSHGNALKAANAAFALADMLKKSNIAFIGPEKPLVARVKNFYLRQIFIKLNPIENIQVQKARIKDCIEALNRASQINSVRVKITVDPM